MAMLVMGEIMVTLPGSQAVAWCRREYVGTWETLMDFLVNYKGISADKSKKARM